MQDFRSLSAAEIKKIPAVRTMRTPGNKSRELADAKNGAVSKGCLRQPRAHNTWAYKSTFSNRAADFR